MQYVFGRQHNGINGFAPILRWYLDEQDFAYPTLRNDWVFNSCSDMDALNDVTDCMESYEWRF